MQLIYLWIKNGKGLPQKQDLNFWGKYTFQSYEEDGIITISYDINTNYLSNFWRDETLLDLTVIVGKNGSGKTSLLSFIGYNIGTDIGVTNTSYICIFKINGREKFTVYNRSHKRLFFDDRLLSSDEKLSFDETQTGYLKHELISLANPCAFIHYSPILNLDIDRGLFAIDLSTTEKILALSTKENQSRSITEFQFNEIIDQLNFIAGSKGIVDLPLPEECRFSFIIKSYLSLLDKINKDSNPKLFSFVQEMHQAFAKVARIAYNEFENFLLHFYYSVQYDLIDKIKAEVYAPEKISFRPVLSDTVSDFLNSLRNNINELTSALEYKYSAFNWLFDLDDLIFSVRERTEVFDADGFTVKISSETLPLIKRFIETLKNDGILMRVFRVSWSGLSSGETNFVNLFSRFYNAGGDFNRFRKHINLSRTNSYGMTEINEIDDAVILIDEGETGLHPQWQKSYVKNLVNTLPKILPFKRVQLIITTNNPIVLSDIPNENTIYLEKENGKVNVHRPSKQNFAANIIDLFRLSFFMKGGLIGEFAKEKLNALAQSLSEKQKLSNEEVEAAKKLINLVGDEMLRMRFEDLLAEKIIGA